MRKHDLSRTNMVERTSDGFQCPNLITDTDKFSLMVSSRCSIYRTGPILCEQSANDVHLRFSQKYYAMSNRTKVLFIYSVLLTTED
jgi:hypothetical protein